MREEVPEGQKGLIMDIYILNVGCGNMALIINPDGTRFVIDCNITEENKDNVLAYVKRIFGQGSGIDVFVNTHRDADHMRGISELNKQHSIKEIWDSDVPGTTTDSPEYLAYMDLRRSVKSKVLSPVTYDSRGDAKYRWMNGKRADYIDVNQQSVVLKIEFKTPGCSVLFTSDTDFRPWKEKILPSYRDCDLKSALLIAAHHGSNTFFDDPSDEKNYYTAHIKKIMPGMTLVSVGPNQHGLPDKKAIELYEKYSNGSNAGNKVYTTEDKNNMKIILKDDGGWSLSVNQ